MPGGLENFHKKHKNRGKNGLKTGQLEKVKGFYLWTSKNLVKINKQGGPNKVRGGWKIFEKLTNVPGRLLGTWEYLSFILYSVKKSKKNLKIRIYNAQIIFQELNLLVKNTLQPNTFVGRKLRHLAILSSLFADKIYTDKVVRVLLHIGEKTDLPDLWAFI